MSIGKNVRRLRQAAGLSQPALAQLAGVTQQLISQLERDQQTSTKALPQIARALGVRVEQIDDNYLQVTPKNASPAALSAPQHAGGQQQLLQVPEVTGKAVQRDSSVSEKDITTQSLVVVQMWQFPEKFLESELNVRREHAVIVKVVGDSMEDGSSSSMRSGDRLVVNRGDADPRQGGIFAVFDGHGIIVIQLEPARSGATAAVVCKPLNPRYSAFILELNKRVFILGRVVSKITRL
jgi:transcriptional regulator with XRE-family HTH domain